MGPHNSAMDPTAHSTGPIYLRTMQQSVLTDGFAMGITMLMALAGLPAHDLVSKCRHMLKHPMQPQRWQSPGMPDEAAGAWPPSVVAPPGV